MIQSRYAWNDSIENTVRDWYVVTYTEVWIKVHINAVGHFILQLSVPHSNGGDFSFTIGFLKGPVRYNFSRDMKGTLINQLNHSMNTLIVLSMLYDNITPVRYVDTCSYILVKQKSSHDESGIQIAGATESLLFHIHHIILWSFGGFYTSSNLFPWETSPVCCVVSSLEFISLSWIYDIILRCESWSNSHLVASSYDLDFLGHTVIYQNDAWITHNSILQWKLIVYFLEFYHGDYAFVRMCVALVVMRLSTINDCQKQTNETADCESVRRILRLSWWRELFCLPS